MRPCEDERLCLEAQVHYYDLLCPEETAVPASVRRHVAACPVCRENMRRLRESLMEAECPARPAGAWQDETVEALAQQFQLLDERVTCSQVKPRLPELALNSPQIRIPTPITVHVDHCPQCAGDLAAIRELHLTADQLKRLSRFLEAGRSASVRGVEGVPPGPEGRAAVPGSGASEPAPIACHEIAWADLFDCVLPSDSPPSAGATARKRQAALAQHLRSCPACLAKARALQRTLREIAARGDSEVVTVYHADKDPGAAEGEYAYPVSVQVLHGASAVRRGNPPWLPFFIRAATGGRPYRKLERSAQPLAALLLIGVALALLLRTTTPTASGTNAGDVDRILARMKNVLIVTRDRSDKPIQEFWIARQSGILVCKTQENCSLYDLPGGRKTTLELQTGSRTSARLSEEERDWARQIMAGYLRRVVAEVSEEVRLRPAGGEMSGGDRGLDVYELPLSPQARRAPLLSRRLVFIDRATGRPQELVSYRQKPGKNGWDLTARTTFSYPSQQEMDEIIRTLFPAE